MSDLTSAREFDDAFAFLGVLATPWPPETMELIETCTSYLSSHDDRARQAYLEKFLEKNPELKP
jgi:hypothetical protein